jgi:hypothetical protein
VQLLDPRRFETGKSFAIPDSDTHDGMFWVSWSDFSSNFSYYTFTR